jgi:Na+/glutamate symporter
MTTDPHYGGTGSGEVHRYYKRLHEKRVQQAQQQIPPRQQYRPTLTPQQVHARRRRRRLRVIDLLLVLPFIATFGWWVEGTHYVSPPLFVLALIVVIVVRNQVVKHRLRRELSGRPRNSRV